MSSAFRIGPSNYNIPSDSELADLFEDGLFEYPAEESPRSNESVSNSSSSSSDLSFPKEKPHLAFRTEGRENEERPFYTIDQVTSLPAPFYMDDFSRDMFERVLKPFSLTLRSSVKVQLISDIMRSKLCSAFDATFKHFEAKTFAPRSFSESPLHLVMKKIVDDFIVNSNITVIDDNVERDCEQLMREFCLVAIHPIDQELIEIGMRFHLVHALFVHIRPYDAAQAEVLFAIGTKRGLFTDPKFDEKLWDGLQKAPETVSEI